MNDEYNISVNSFLVYQFNNITVRYMIKLTGKNSKSCLPVE